MSGTSIPGVTIGQLQNTNTLNPGDLVPVTQGYTGPGTGQTRHVAASLFGSGGRGGGQRTVAMSISGLLVGEEVFPVMFAQAGTLLSTGAVGSGALGPPLDLNVMALSITQASGSVVVFGSIEILATTGAVAISSFGSQTVAAGDMLVITNQSTADVAGANYAFAFPFIVT